jgi:uncharacterized coiled-coil DUF342 family protein
MAATQTSEPMVTFEQFMASMKELRESMKEDRERMKEDSERIRERMKEDRERMREDRERMKEDHKRIKDFNESMQKLKESQEETSRQMKMTDKKLGELTNRFGEMVEYMVIPNLLTKFEEMGFTFTKANRTEIKDKKNNIFTKVDAFLENGDKVMIVEIKTKPNIEDINTHMERMEKLRKYADLRSDRRGYLGAIAGVVFSDSEKVYALKNGFYVIEPSGDTFNITEPTGRYHPREW